MNNDFIVIKGARQNNLKNVDLKIPRSKLTVITGVSGSGKSTLAFDTIYAEGQRRYVESLSAYARQFLGKMDKPDVDSIDGLSPAISIDQKGASVNPRSTVGTVTEIYDYLRLLYARIGIPHCYKCGKEITSMTVSQMVDTIFSIFELKEKFLLLAPIVRGRKGTHEKLISSAFSKGYTRLRVDGEIVDEESLPQLDRNKKHSIEIVVDRLTVNPELKLRLSSSLETALEEGGGVVIVASTKGREELFSEHLSCPDCNISIEELQPRFFSFNSPYGACPTCLGLGTCSDIDPNAVVPDRSLSVKEGAIKSWGKMVLRHVRYNNKESIFWARIIKFAQRYSIDLETPFEKLSPTIQKLLLYGNGGHTLYTVDEMFEGAINNLRRRYHETNSEQIKLLIERYMSESECPTCHGMRLKPEVLAVTVGGKDIAQFTAMTISQAYDFVQNLKLTTQQQMISEKILKELLARFKFLKDVGLSYLTLDRKSLTLSGGEAQRIRLATQIGSGLTGVLYVLDEPSIGLHQRDNVKLIRTLKSLCDLGNSVLVVEHDREMMEAADYIVDIGPRAGAHGGEIVATGTYEEISHSEDSITGKYLSGKLSIPIPQKRRMPDGRSIKIVGATENNLKNLSVELPLGLFLVVTGVSGSGKSTLVNDILYRSLARKLYSSTETAGRCKAVQGVELIDKVIVIDQSPIGRTPRSNPATYTGVFTPIRELFSLTQDAKMYGYTPGRFSFNVRGGRCEACQGDGIIRIEMHFLPDIYVACEECKGKRYNPPTLSIHFKGKNIYDVLEMTVDEALLFFENIPQISRKLKTLSDVGLGYMKLGQNAVTLSGGEAQRVKLATELSKRPTGKTLYILDEPTTGLHFDDIDKLLKVLLQLVETGNSVILIEHNMDVIKNADYIIDLGPEGGDGGGTVVAKGTPEELVAAYRAGVPTYTGEFLEPILYPTSASVPCNSFS